MVCVIEMLLKNIISMFVLVMIMLMIPTMAYAQAPPLNMGIICSGLPQSDYDYMINPGGNVINMHDFAGYGSLYGYPHPRLHNIGPHLNKMNIDTAPYGGWGEPTSVGACGHFYGLGII